MAYTSLNEVTALIKQQIESHEYIQEQLWKAEAIAHVALSDEFLDYKRPIIHAYLWALCDIIAIVKNNHETALNNLLNEGII